VFVCPGNRDAVRIKHVYIKIGGGAALLKFTVAVHIIVPTRRRRVIVFTEALGTCKVCKCAIGNFTGTERHTTVRVAKKAISRPAFFFATHATVLVFEYTVYACTVLGF